VHYEISQASFTARDRATQHGNFWSSDSQNIALQGIIMFDYENLRRLVSQIRSDDGYDLGADVIFKVNSFAEKDRCVGKTATASGSLAFG